MTTTQHNQEPPARHSIDSVKTWRAWREPPARPARVALALAIAVWAAVLLVYEYAGDFFDRNAHGAAATAMFLCIIGVACINIREYKRLHRRRTYWNRYTPVAAARGSCG